MQSEAEAESDTESEFEANPEELESSESSVNEESDYQGSDASDDPGSSVSYESDDGDDWEELERKAAKCNVLCPLFSDTFIYEYPQPILSELLKPKVDANPTILMMTDRKRSPLRSPRQMERGKGNGDPTRLCCFRSSIVFDVTSLDYISYFSCTATAIQLARLIQLN